MDPLYEKLLKTPFPTNVLAIEYCRAVCAEFGFTVKQEASANKVNLIYRCIKKETKMKSLEHLRLLFSRRST